MNPQMVPEDVPTAGEHVKRIVEGYSLETSPQLKDLDKLTSAAIVKLQLGFAIARPFPLASGFGSLFWCF